MQRQRPHGQVGHVFLHVKALFVVSRNAPVTHQLCERSLNHSAPWLNSTTLLPLQTPQDFHCKVEKRSPVPDCLRSYAVSPNRRFTHG